MIDLQTMLTYLTLISVPVGVFYHIMTLRNTRKNQELTLKAQEQALETRQAQLFMHIYSNWYNIDFWEKWENVMQFDYRGYDDANERLTPEIKLSARSLFAFFEGLGVLVKRGLIGPELIDDLMSAMIVSFWDKWKDFYIEYRVRRNAPMVAEWIEYLYNVIKPMMEEQHPEMREKELSLQH